MLNTEKTLKFSKTLSGFTDKKRSGIPQCVHFLKKDDKCVYYATNGHIAIRVIIFSELAIIQSDILIKEISDNDLVQFNGIFNKKPEPGKSEGFFDPRYIDKAAKSINAIASLFNKKLQTMQIIIGEESPALFSVKEQGYCIDVLIMPKRK
jgi:hypothetical protein